MAPITNDLAAHANEVFTTYALFMMTGGGIYHLVAGGAFSSILTLSVLMQCLGLALLALQVIKTSSAAHISARSLMLETLALCCRLSSTLWLHGYLPADKTGDHVFQMIDITSVCILLWLIYQVMVAKRDTYHQEEDSFPVFHMVIASFLLAALFHGTLNRRPLFDMLWMAGLNMGTVAVCPQLWLVTRTGGRIKALTGHHIAAVATSKILASLFMFHAREDIICVPWVGLFNHAKWAIQLAYLVHMLLLCDFAYYYLKTVLANGLNSDIDLLESCNV